MKAYRVKGLRSIELDEMEAQPVGENCIKLKNLMCGISSIDVGVFTGRFPAQFPIIPTRQCVGFVSEVGSAVTGGVQRGNRVVVYPQACCHGCKPCKDARYYACEKQAMFGKGEDGFLSDFSVVSADDVYSIPDRLKDEEAVFTEHTAMAINVISKLKIDKGEHLVIVGATSIGIILAQVAMYHQAVPIVVDMRDELLESARRAGVYYTINSVDEDVSKKVLALTGGHMADACAYLLSSPMPLRNVFDYTTKRGRIALVGRIADDSLTVSLNSIIDKRVDIYSVTDCSKFFPSAINMLANHTVSIDMLPRRIVPFADVPATFEEMASGVNDGIKTLVKI